MLFGRVLTAPSLSQICSSWPITIENGRQTGIIATSSLSILCPTIFVILRVIAKRRISNALNWSDACLFVALVLNFGLQINTILLVTHGGLGMPPDELVTRFGDQPADFFSKALVSLSILWNCTILWSKMSVLFLFTSLIPVPRMILPAGTTMLLVVLSHVGYIITQFTICRPFSRLWDNLEPGVCGNVAIFYSIVGMTDSVANVIILILPMPFVYILDIKWTKKLALASILGIGLLTSAISIYRQTLLPELALWATTNASPNVIVLSALEPAVVITLACVPYLWPLTRRIAQDQRIFCHEAPNPLQCGLKSMMRFGTWYKSGVEGEAVEDVLGRSQYESSIVELQLIRIGWDPFPVMLSPSADGSATLQNSDTGSPSRCNDI